MTKILHLLGQLWCGLLGAAFVALGVLNGYNPSPEGFVWWAILGGFYEFLRLRLTS